MMPNWFKNYLNRGYEVIVEEVINKDLVKTEMDLMEETVKKEEKTDISDSKNVEIKDKLQEGIEEIVKLGVEISESFDLITFLGTALSEKINKNIVISKGLIRVAINDKYPTPPKYMQFDEWVSLIMNELVNK